MRECEADEECAIMHAASVDPPGAGTFRIFMLTHGKQVRRVSFLLDAMKAASRVVLRRIDKVSFWLAVVIT